MTVLVIAPHADDETIGCGGLIARRVCDGHAVDIVVATIGNGIKADVRWAELRTAAEILGTREPTVLYEGYDAKLDTLPRRHLIAGLEAVLERTAYDEVYFNYASHHQDHRVLHEAALAALREKGRAGPSLIAMYEYAYVGWTPNDLRAGRLYVDIEPFMATKELALKAYRSRLCPPGHPTSWEATETLARMRGLECGKRFAELFYVLKLVQ